MKRKAILNNLSLKSTLIVAAMLTVSYASSAPAITLYKWVDEEGNISYQDQPPEKGQKYEERSFSSEGTRTGDTNNEIARSRAIQENPVTLYTAENCDSCDLVGKILDSNNIPFEKIPVDNAPDAQKVLSELIGSIRVPTLIIGEKVINVSNRAAIEDALRKSGYPAVQTEAVPQ